MFFSSGLIIYQKKVFYHQRIHLANGSKWCFKLKYKRAVKNNVHANHGVAVSSEYIKCGITCKKY